MTWTKEVKRGHVVMRLGNPVYVAKIRCPPQPLPLPPSGSTPSSGPGNAAVAVYAIRVQGYTFNDTDLSGSIPARSYTPIENVDQQGYLIRLITPFPGLNGPAQDEIGIFLGSLVDLGPRAGTMQFGTNTLMFTAANPSDPSLFDQLPAPYDMGKVAVQGNQLSAVVTLQDIEGVSPPGGKSPDYFVDRTGLFAGTVKNANGAAVLLQFANGDGGVTGVFEIQGFASLASAGLIPPSEYGEFGFRGTIAGTRISAPGGVPIYLPPPLPTTPRPPGCRTELHLVPGLADGTLTDSSCLCADESSGETMEHGRAAQNLVSGPRRGTPRGTRNGRSGVCRSCVCAAGSCGCGIDRCLDRVAGSKSAVWSGRLQRDRVGVRGSLRSGCAVRLPSRNDGQF